MEASLTLEKLIYSRLLDIIQSAELTRSSSLICERTHDVGPVLKIKVVIGDILSLFNRINAGFQ